MPDVLRYGSHPSQFGTLTLPDSPGPWPVAVVLHGGFWRATYGCELGTGPAEDLRRHGFASWNLEYRRVGADPIAGGGGWPGTCADVAAGVDLLASAGQQVAGGRLDLSRVVAVGHSAGGHLAAWLAGRAARKAHAPGSTVVVPVTGVVSQAGVLDLALALADDLGSGAVEAFLGTAGTDSSVLALASPVESVPTGVPVVCVHGTDDDDVPIEQSRRFEAAATQTGDRARLVAIEGADHFAPIDLASPAWAACRAAALELSR